MSALDTMLPDVKTPLLQKTWLIGKDPDAGKDSVQSVISVAQSCPTICNPMNRSSPGLPVHHQLLEFTQIHVHRVGDAIQPSHTLSSPSPPSFNLSQHKDLFQWVGCFHQVAKVLKLPFQASVLPKNIQGLFSLGLIGLITLHSKGLLRAFSNTTV